ncbi:MAG: twitching motility protein PilT [Gallionellales bacterium RIFCSPLOWO2_12_FULL_59_22]|nr:MAG: twitching motility protein PilT [Gallionellales bacterium RIFCSPLOWO2_02_FULL_59_110]OGT05061.1 MAG: twitching motility protein PilT [Gallionellales bacterium RIFCSPLOWO2_02_58_13]OGT14559.1 MAG: twitching motility protein PilT [Gallionellales bacterium RIFCSPLOWO2_12_FULL_59_22]
MIGLDTNVLVRYLAQDDKSQSAAAGRLIERELSQETPGFVSLIVLVETVWVLESCYGSSRADIAAVLERLLRVKQLKIQDAETAWRALRLFLSCKADFSDCLIERLGHANGCLHTATFDKVAAKSAGMKLL